MYLVSVLHASPADTVDSVHGYSKKDTACRRSCFVMWCSEAFLYFIPVPQTKCRAQEWELLNLVLCASSYCWQTAGFSTVWGVFCSDSFIHRNILSEFDCTKECGNCQKYWLSLPFFYKELSRYYFCSFINENVAHKTCQLCTFVFYSSQVPETG